MTADTAFPPELEAFCAALWAVGGIATMFVLNLSVSFACSLWSAAKAYELSVTS